MSNHVVDVQNVWRGVRSDEIERDRKIDGANKARDVEI